MRDDKGLTALCRATHAMDVAAVGAALDAGAAVDGQCAGATSLAFVVRAGPGDFVRKRAVVEVLLVHGADPDPTLYPGASYTARSFCADNFPECQRELLPLPRHPAPTYSASACRFTRPPLPSKRSAKCTRLASARSWAFSC